MRRCTTRLCCCAHCSMPRPSATRCGCVLRIRGSAKGVAASGALATRLGLSGVPAAAETIALHAIFELMRLTGARVHLCRLSQRRGHRARSQRQGRRSAGELRREHQSTAPDRKRHRLLRCVDADRLRRCANSAIAMRSAQALADGTVDALVSDHTPVDEDAKTLPFAEAEPGATGLELLLSLALKWGEEQRLDLAGTLARITCQPVRVLGDALGSLATSTRPARRRRYCRRVRVRSGGALDRQRRRIEKPGQAHAVCVQHQRYRAARPRALHAGGRISVVHELDAPSAMRCRHALCWRVVPRSCSHVVHGLLIVVLSLSRARCASSACCVCNGGRRSCCGCLASR